MALAGFVHWLAIERYSRSRNTVGFDETMPQAVARQTLERLLGGSSK
jgi:hypothetical protein